MNTDSSSSEYFILKTNFNALAGAITDKKSEIDVCEREFSELQARIDEEKITLRREEELMLKNSRMKRPTLTMEEYKTRKDALAEDEARLPDLKESLDFKSRELAMLKVDWADARSRLDAIKDSLLTDLVNQSVDEFTAVAGDSFKKLVMALVVVKGRQRGYGLDERREFHTAMYDFFFKKTLPGIFDGPGRLPDLNEANQYITSILEDQGRPAGNKANRQPKVG